MEKLDLIREELLVSILHIRKGWLRKAAYHAAFGRAGIRKPTFKFQNLYIVFSLHKDASWKGKLETQIGFKCKGKDRIARCDVKHFALMHWHLLAPSEALVDL